jgi:hypothetical protein
MHQSTQELDPPLPLAEIMNLSIQNGDFLQNLNMLR